MGERDKLEKGKREREDEQPLDRPRSRGDVTPFSFMRRLFEDMDRLFGVGDLGGGGMRLFGQDKFDPQIDVFERDGMLVVRADVPGVKREDIQVDVDDEGIVISGERKQENEEHREGYHHTERVYGSFERRIALPRGVDASSCDASFQDGVLEITMPLGQKERRRIDVKGGGPAQERTTQAGEVPIENGPAPAPPRH